MVDVVLGIWDTCGMREMVAPFVFEKRAGAGYRLRYDKICRDLNGLVSSHDSDGFVEMVRTLSLKDMFFFAYFVLGLHHLNHPWVLDRVYEVSDHDDMSLFLWSRGHFKSTIISLVKPLHVAIADPEECQCWLSHTKMQSDSFLMAAKMVMERNELLQNCFSYAFWKDPQAESPLWDSRKGLLLRRDATHRTYSFEAYGLVERLPTGKHFSRIYYDDIVTQESVSTGEQMDKLAHGFGLSINLVTENARFIVTGTHYHHRDQYVTLKEAGDWRVSEWPATDDPTLQKDGYYWSAEKLQKKRRAMGPYVFSAQCMLNPVPDANQVFRVEWLNGRFFKVLPSQLNKYILVDPANEKKEGTSDFTVMLVIGVDFRGDFYLVDGLRDRLNPTERWVALRNLALIHNPREIGYEKYGMQADTHYITERKIFEGIPMPDPIPLAGNMRKPDRIKRLVPTFETGRMHLPEALEYVTLEGIKRDLVKDLVNEEYVQYPFPKHDDILDCMCRIHDEALCAVAPVVQRNRDKYLKKVYNPLADKKKPDRTPDFEMW